jgi:hypothetical protein
MAMAKREIISASPEKYVGRVRNPLTQLTLRATMGILIGAVQRLPKRASKLPQSRFQRLFKM